MSAPLVLLPGLLCDATVWAPQKAALHGELRVAAWLHFYGHDSLAGMAREVLKAAPPSFALAGHSMGGRVALEIMRTAPERVERLALLDTTATPAMPDEPDKRRELIELARTQGMQALAARWLPMIVHPSRLNQQEFMSALTGMICRATPEIYVRQVQALLNRPDYRPVLPQIACPTLVACGRDDLWSPVAVHEEIAATIPGAKLAVIENCGHMATVESPGEVSALLRDWLQ
ncbi:MAG TPA: alpha/beta fold hydrolase [Micropepsaceae bacterium]|nr:alpha/beta fold hydrolase [Micropepsaceae bacterium]